MIVNRQYLEDKVIGQTVECELGCTPQSDCQVDIPTVRQLANYIACSSELPTVNIRLQTLSVETTTTMNQHRQCRIITNKLSSRFSRSPLSTSESALESGPGCKLPPRIILGTQWM